MKTGNRIKERFMWKGIWNDVRKIVATCDECQRMNKKPITTPTVLHPVPVHSPWHHIGMDFIGSIHPISVNGNRFVLTISDYFTKWVEAIPLPSKCALGVAKALFKVFMRMGLPKLLTSDQGGEFRSEIDKHIMKLLGIKRHFITPYHPQANGLDERWNQTLKHMIVKYTNDNKEQWDTYLDTCVFAYNTARQESTLHSPFELMFGRKANLPVDIDYASHTGEQTLDEYKATADCNSETINILTSNHRKMLTDAKNNITISQDKQKEQYDRKNDTRPLKYNIGTVVLLKDFRRKKRKGGGMDYKWLGPYKIVKDLGKGFFALHSTENGKSVKRVHGAHLKLYQNPLSELKQDDSTFTSTLSGEDQSDNIQLHVTLSDSSSDEESLSSTPPPLPPSIMPNSDSMLMEVQLTSSNHTDPQPSKPLSQFQEEKKSLFSECSQLPYKTLWQMAGDGIVEREYVIPIMEACVPPSSQVTDVNNKKSNENPILMLTSCEKQNSFDDQCDDKNLGTLVSSKCNTGNDSAEKKVYSLRKRRLQMHPAACRDKKRRMQKHEELQKYRLNNEKECVDLTQMQPNQDCKKDKHWIEEFRLTFSHKESIINGDWLTDDIINAGLKLLEMSYPAMGGLQSAALGETLSFDVCHGNFVQILNVAQNHWITVSRNYGQDKNHVTLYDSLSCGISLRTKEQIASLCFCDYKEITIEIPDVQKQQGGSDCGLFALAFTTSLCANNSPSEIYYTQHQFRNHLVTCFEKRLMSPFPARKRKRLPGMTRHSKILIYCHCRQPESFDRMVECSICKEWFHEQCENVPREVWTNQKYQWKCKNC